MRVRSIRRPACPACLIGTQGSWSGGYGAGQCQRHCRNFGRMSWTLHCALHLRTEMETNAVRRALVRIRRGLLLDLILAVVILGVWGGFQWAGRAVDRIEPEMNWIFQELKNCWQTREAEPGEVPSFVTQEEGVERRWKKVLVDREEQQRLMKQLDALERRVMWIREGVSALMFVLLAFPLFRILATWWTTALPLTDRTEEMWRWLTRIAAIATGLAIWIMLAQTVHQPAMQAVSRSGWAQLAALLTASGTLRYLTTVAVVVEDPDYLAHNRRIVLLLQIWAAVSLAQILLPRGVVAALAVWLNLAVGIVTVLTAASYIWQISRLRASIAAVLNS